MIRMRCQPCVPRSESSVSPRRGPKQGNERRDRHRQDAASEDNVEADDIDENFDSDLSGYQASSGSDRSVEGLRDSDHASSDEGEDGGSFTGNWTHQQAVGRDINVTDPTDHAAYDALDSDGTDSAISTSDDDYTPRSDVSSVCDTSDDDISDVDDELADLMDSDVHTITNDEDILRAARRKQTMKEWQFNGWDAGELVFQWSGFALANFCVCSSTSFHSRREIPGPVFRRMGANS
jgi:hypothetical protein